MTTTTANTIDRDEAIATIRAALRRRSRTAWSVTGGRGTVNGWITINVPPRRRDACDNMPAADRAELARLFGLDSIHSQGLQIAASQAHYREYIDRAEGRQPAEIAAPYWD